MALYSYKAMSKDGKGQKGFVEASSLSSAKEQLLRRGFFISEVLLAKEASVSLPWYKKLFQGSVSEKDKILFTKQLSILLRSGIPLLQSLELLMEQVTGNLRSILVSVKDGIKEGHSLAEELKKYPKVFDSIYVQLVRAGEATGKLEIILDRLTTYLERKQEIQKKIKGALNYPLTQLVMITLVVIFLLSYVVPQMAQTLMQRGQQMPTPTRILLSLSGFIVTHYIFLPLILIGLFVSIRYWLSTPSGALTFDKIKLKLPVIKYFAKTNAIVQFSRTLGMLLESGVNLSEALDIVVNIIDNKILAKQLRDARDKIVKQGKIAQFLKETGIFPAIAIYLIKTGEETGELDTMLLIVAENYETELSEMTTSLTAKIEPIMMIFMALVVGFIVMSIALPLTQMNQAV
ncbi:MAG: type II secretion system F family protein [Candidatus Babeliales bacterium]|nr:type II secretion system F family protein [Candidatus Babeliales bacterium]